MTTSMDFAKGIANLDGLMSSVITIEGFLVQMGDELYIVPSEDAWQSKDEAMLVRDESARSRLLQAVPIWVGGPLYQDQVSITGELSKAMAPPFRADLRRISALTLTRDSKIFKVLP